MEPCPNLAPRDAPAPRTCARIAEYRLDMELCDRLETLADRLPGLPDALWVQQTLESLTAAAARWEEGATALPGLVGHDPARRLYDSAQAYDVIEELQRYWMTPDPARVGQLSYMLRALFEGRLRAMMIERLCLGCSNCAYSAAS
ncbi:hypothetical protein [Sphingomicrobium nitratireducens]|uniref:hypothetical protein n=1 Tax=Sphingomicrobium nitratireducens TaxID=2964666 RepID=UPI00223F6C96|nr:hypothetical protein [Sphingomicrobium nitratireducens]